ncbi:uncharacterized protein, partial [Argopecten irradians]|uniref:uncharacterized protein n=1 Tax=Argopecten irradians TaxID=31199 RepID=UPI00371E2268
PSAVPSSYRRNESFITLFTSWNTFPERFEVYNNTLLNWPLLQPSVNLILFTDDDVPDTYRLLGWTILPIKRKIKGYPVLKHLFLEAMQQRPFSKLYAFSNGDLLFTDSFVKTLVNVVNSSYLQQKPYMIVGRRMNTPNITKKEARSWENIARAAKWGELMNERWGIDYFITPPKYHWKDIPELQIGQNYYDNWLVYDARQMGYDVVDVTETLLAVHQNSLYPKDQVSMNNNLGYLTVSRGTIYNKGVVPCCAFYTFQKGNTITLGRKKVIPDYCKK